MNELSRFTYFKLLYTDATPSPFNLACLVVWSAPRGYFMETIHSRRWASTLYGNRVSSIVEDPQFRTL